MKTANEMKQSDIKQIGKLTGATIDAATADRVLMHHLNTFCEYGGQAFVAERARRDAGLEPHFLYLAWADTSKPVGSYAPMVESRAMSLLHIEDVQNQAKAIGIENTQTVLVLAEMAVGTAHETCYRPVFLSCQHHRCALPSCGRFGADLSRCERCKEAWYCRKECQVAHWKTHKKACKRPKT